MKVFINNRDYLTWTRNLVIHVAEQGHEPIVIDNGSTYPPLLEWYSHVGFRLIRCENLGAYAFWKLGLAKEQSEPFVVTDSDCDITGVPSDWPEVLSEGLKMFPHVSKVGLSWDETTVPTTNPWYRFFHMDEFPEGSGFWHNNLLEGNWHNAPCDTSFALYRPNNSVTIDGVRKGRPYTGIHLPFHISLDPCTEEGKKTVPMTEEIAYYLEHANPGQGWSHAAILFKNMVEEFRRRNGTRVY